MTVIFRAIKLKIITPFSGDRVNLQHQIIECLPLSPLKTRKGLLIRRFLFMVSHIQFFPTQKIIILSTKRLIVVC